MRGSRNFRQGGGGGQGQSDKKSSDNRFFSPQLILLKSNGLFRRKLSFFKVPEGSNILQGGPSFSRGGGGGYNCLFPIETHITCDFPGGGRYGPPVPPLDPHLLVFICPSFHFNICLQTMSIIPPLRVTQLQMELRRNRRREQALIVALAVFEQQLARHERKERTVWMKPWLLRRVTLGYYGTLMQELMRESRGDFKAFLRIEPPMFREMVDRLTPRISKHQDCRPGLPAGLPAYRHLATSTRSSCGHRTIYMRLS